MTIEGKELLEIVPNFATAPAIASQRQFTPVNLSHGRRVMDFNGRSALHSMNHEFVFATAAEWKEFHKFFYDRRGRWGAFWVPSWHGELNPVASLLEDGDELSITEVKYNETYPLDPDDMTTLGRYVWLLRIDGVRHISKVLSVANGSPEVLTLETPAPADFPLGSFVVGFLYHVRFGDDTVRFTYTGPNAAKVSMSVVEVLNVKAEPDA